MRLLIMLISGNSPDSTANGCVNRFRISKSKSVVAQLEHAPCDMMLGILTHVVDASSSTWWYIGDSRLLSMSLRKYVGDGFKRIKLCTESASVKI